MVRSLRISFAVILGSSEVTYQDMIQHKRRECEGTDRAIRHAFAGHPAMAFAVLCTLGRPRREDREKRERRQEAKLIAMGFEHQGAGFASMHLSHAFRYYYLAGRRECKAMKTWDSLGIRLAGGHAGAMGTERCLGWGNGTIP